jgi:hypothetical protein
MEIVNQIRKTGKNRAAVFIISPERDGEDYFMTPVVERQGVSRSEKTGDWRL